MDFKAEVVDGKTIVKAIVERKGNDVTVHVPSLKLMHQFQKEQKNKENR